MHTKEKCMAFLAQVEQKIKNNVWEAQVDDVDQLISHNDMLEILPHFGLPQPEYIDNSCVYLPAEWLENEDVETSEDYREVAEKFLEIYNTLRYEVSRECEALEIAHAQELQAMYREYYSSVM